MSNLLEPEIITTVTGEAIVQQIFEITVKKTKEKIAGCKVQTGKIMRNLKVRVIRNGNQVFEGKVRTFKHHKKDILEALKGLECGIALEDFGGFEEGDVVQSLTITTKKQKIQ
jgi:translation initiation factor IF-2